MKKGIIITIIFIIILLILGIIISINYTNFKNDKTFNEPYAYIEETDKGIILNYIGVDREVKPITKFARGEYDSVFDAKNNENVIYSNGGQKIARIAKDGTSKVVNLCKKYSSIKNCKISYITTINVDKKGNTAILMYYKRYGYGYSNLVIVNDKLKLIYNKEVEFPTNDVTFINNKVFLLCSYFRGETNSSYMNVMSVDYKNNVTKTVLKEKKVSNYDEYISILNNKGQYNILYNDKKDYNILIDNSNDIIFKVKGNFWFLSVIDDSTNINILLQGSSDLLKNVKGKNVAELDFSEYGDYLVDIDFINDDIFTVIGNSLFIFDSNNLDKEPKEYLYGIDELIDDNRDIEIVSFFAGE